jgi:hypothetical protein
MSYVNRGFPDDDLLDMVADLERENAALRREAEIVDAQFDAVLKERDIARADAERYRWLRTGGAVHIYQGSIDVFVTPDEFDAAIDALRKPSSPACASP